MREVEVVRAGYRQLGTTFDEWPARAGRLVHVTFSEPEGEATFQWILARS